MTLRAYHEIPEARTYAIGRSIGQPTVTIVIFSYNFPHNGGKRFGVIQEDMLEAASKLTGSLVVVERYRNGQRHFDIHKDWAHLVGSSVIAVPAQGEVLRVLSEGSPEPVDLGTITWWCCSGNPDEVSFYVSTDRINGFSGTVTKALYVRTPDNMVLPPVYYRKKPQTGSMRYIGV